MINYFLNSSVVIQALLATIMTFLITSLGAAIVFLFKKVKANILDGMLGLSAGVMVAASFFSLINPAIEEATNLGMCAWFISSLGFLIGGLFLIISDKFFDKFLKKTKKNSNDNSLKRILMLIFSITLHNIPEGLAIGVAFGSIGIAPGVTVTSAFMLAVGVGIQNFPEGCAVSLPLRRENYSRKKSFIYGALSGIVEPIAGVIGCILVRHVTNALPFLLCFAAGAMIYVAVSELIPESQKNKSKNLMSFFTILGFTIMMLLDVAFS